MASKKNRSRKANRKSPNLRDRLIVRVRTLFAWVDGHRWRAAIIAIVLLLATYGLGAAEVLGIRLEDVDWQGVEVVLSGHEVPGEGEGLAMCEIIHDLAPGATIWFATGASGEQQMADNIIALANAGCTIIVATWCVGQNRHSSPARPVALEPVSSADRCRPRRHLDSGWT